jgi:hypothetical protein
MNELRAIREEEIDLIKQLLKLALVDYLADNIPAEVSSYNPKQKESINLSMNKNMDYNGDIVRVEYVDTDDVLVTITLTKNKNGQLLDLDFWKEGFIPLEEYPTPEKIKIVR